MIVMENSCFSLTPPLSPDGSPNLSPAESDDEEQVIEEEHVTHFHCLGEVNVKEESYHPEGYLKSQYLEKVLVNTEVRYGQHQHGVQIFGHDWPTLLTEDHIETLFLIMRQKIGYIHSMAIKANSFMTTDVGRERGQINASLELVLMQVRSSEWNGDLPAEVLGILREMHTLLNDIGRISEVQHLTSHAALNRNSVKYEYFHLHLDIYWRLLCMVHLIQTNYPDTVYGCHLYEMQSDETVPPVYDQLLHIILWDLVSISQIRYQSAVKDSDYRKVSPFPCSCVKELWLLCIRLSQLRTSKLNGEFFWLSLHHIIKTILDWKLRDKELSMEMEDCCMITNPPDVFKVEDSIGLCMWLISNIAPLYSNTHLSMNEKPDTYVSNYHDLQTILKRFMTSLPVSESALKRHLHVCLTITSYWEPNTKLLNDLWEYFYRRLSDTFVESSGTVDGLACMDKTVAGFYSKCKRWTSGGKDRQTEKTLIRQFLLELTDLGLLRLQSIDKDTSFQLFLRILTQHLGQLNKGDSRQEWKQLKGRIYSKFYPRRIQELTDGGLYNLTCLFLTLAITTNLEDVGSKLCDFYDMLDFEHITLGKRSVIWRGAFTLMMIHEERGMDISFLADKMNNTLQHCVSDFKKADTSKQRIIWELVRTYLEGTLELIESSATLSLSENKLIGPAIGSLLPLCSENQLRHVLGVIQTVVNKFRQVLNQREKEENIPLTEKDQHQDFADCLWKHVYKFIVDHSQTLTPSVEVGDIAAEFCLLSLKYPPPVLSKDTFLTVFQTFASGEKTNASVSCRFLGHLLGHSNVTARLQQDLGSWEPYVVRCWFQCCVLIPSPSDPLEVVTRLVLQLAEVRGLFQQASMEIPTSSHNAPVQFLKALHKAHVQIESWQAKMQFQQRVIPYFTDIHKLVGPVLRNQCPTKVLSNVYHLFGNMMKYCAKLVYVRQDIIVPSILSSLILPQLAVDKDKPVNQAWLSVVKETLHLFIQGLGRLAYERDLFVQRRLKDIILTYLPKFSIRPSPLSMGQNSETSVHPIVAGIGGSFVLQPSQEAIKFRHYLMQVVIENFLEVKRMTIHPQHVLGWSFLSEVTNRTTSTAVKARDLPVVLMLCLEYLIHLPELSSVLPQITTVIQHTAKAHASNVDSTPLTKLSEICKGFVRVYSRYNLVIVLNVMDKLTLLHQPLVTSVIGELSNSMLEIENKRGVGSDQVVRKKYYTILQGLGKKGEEELARLKS